MLLVTHRVLRCRCLVSKAASSATQPNPTQPNPTPTRLEPTWSRQLAQFFEARMDAHQGGAVYRGVLMVWLRRATVS